MINLPKPAIVTMTRVLCLTPLLFVAACASDGPPGSIEEMRSNSYRATNPVPDGVTEMRETLAGQRSETNALLDSVMGAAPAGDSGYWYTPIFDALDAAVSVGKWLY